MRGPLSPAGPCPPPAMKPPIEPGKPVYSRQRALRHLRATGKWGKPCRVILPPERCGTWRPRPARQGRSGRCTGGNSPGIAAILSCNARRNPMFDTLTPRSTTGEFKTMPCARPDPGGFLLEARTGAREAAAHMKDLAERFAELRNAIMRLPNNPSRDGPRRAPPPASPSREHPNGRKGQPRRRHHRHHGRQRRGPLMIRAAVAGQSRASDCRRAMPPNSPACLDQRAREFEEGKEKGDAPKGKESSLRAVSQPHQPEVPDVRSHS